MSGFWNVNVGSSSGSSSVEISLPFTSKADSGTTRSRTTSALMHKYCDIDNNYINIVGYIGQNENYFRIYNVIDNNDLVVNSYLEILVLIMLNCFSHLFIKQVSRPFVMSIN